ncbi:TonB family protein [bacterium]|nr:TonB family protein [bacterium]MBU1636346.1 TonB family protein [bacterium]MBU1920284.1 TonB family protein [bacterium]RQV95416.1 MAG: TonB family protein [bacterium]
MRRGPFFASCALHILIVLALTLAGRQSIVNSRPLPAATVVKLVRPQAIPIAAPPTVSKEFKLPETAPPMLLPSKKKTEPKTEPKPVPKAEQPKKRSSKETPKELKGEAGTLKLQNPGFEYDFYLALIQSKIERNFRPPPGVRGEHMATVTFVITKNGSMINIGLIQSSGNLLIDQSAERAVRAAGRFPPLPPQYEQGELGINFEFVVNSAAGG